MRLSELRRGADPARADDEENLRQNEIAKAERLFKRGAMLFDVASQRARVQLASLKR